MLNLKIIRSDRMKKKISIIAIILGSIVIITGIIIALTNKQPAETLPKVESQDEIAAMEKYKKEMTEMLLNASYRLTNEVNNLEFDFTARNTVYAVPLECIAYSSDKESSNKKWEPNSNERWAYILIQYDDDTSSYNFGYTYKDNNGYGIYPIANYRVQEDGSDIEKNLQLNKPKTGLITKLTTIENWVKFNKFSKLNETTNLIVLTAVTAGNNIDTCTIQR
jgi:hypothetical protein